MFNLLTGQEPNFTLVGHNPVHLQTHGEAGDFAHNLTALDLQKWREDSRRFFTNASNSTAQNEPLQEIQPIIATPTNSSSRVAITASVIALASAMILEGLRQYYYPR